MGRGTATSGMEDAEPTTETPSFIASFEGGGTKSSGKSPTETSFPDRRVGDLDLGSPDGPRDAGGEGVGEKDARGTVPINHNPGGGGGEPERRRASVVEILRRNLGVSKSPSLRGWAQFGVEHENRDGTASDRRLVADGVDGERGCRNPDPVTGDAGSENERTAGGLTPHAHASGLESSHPADPCGHKRDPDKVKVTLDDPADAGEHIYCTVYCIDNERRAGEDGATRTFGIAQEAGSDPELHTADDLVDPFGDATHRQAGGEAAVRSCRVCLEGKSIAPLPCCRKAVCDECLELYVSSQVGGGRRRRVCVWVMERGGGVEWLSCPMQQGVAALRWRLFQNPGQSAAGSSVLELK